MAKVSTYIVERLGLQDTLQYASQKAVPQHKHSFWYFWGGISLFSFLIQVVTGILLMVYYRPGPEAHESVRQITYQMNFGWLIRSTHNWAASIFIVSIFVHMFSVYFMKAYRKPREFLWLSGVVLLLLGLTFGFSGYLLPMDMLSYFATKVGLEIPKSLPFIGPAVADILRGGIDVTEFTVQRFFALHTVILPMVFIPFLLAHLWMVQKHGNSLPESEEAKPETDRKSIPFFPNFLMQDLAMWLIALNVIALLAAMFPWQLGEPADPLKPAPVGIHPEWYFMSPFQTLKLIGKLIPGAAGEVIGMSVFTLGMVLWILIPFYDVKSKGAQRAKRATYFGLLALFILVGTSAWGYLGVQ
ncbi:MAG: cytochrome bc complex cytochrome b subunit [Armatimonadetes bacterium]|nr:cytochrome bc complex cytochrome b subunit [Armatimonadota bacterium]